MMLPQASAGTNFLPMLVWVVLTLVRMITVYEVVIAVQSSNSSPESWYPIRDVPLQADRHFPGPVVH